ncbi:MAG: ABC transporter substrate-binding protein [Paracoccaceae bacterium]
MNTEALVLQKFVQLVDPHDCTDAKDALSILQAVYDTLVVRGPGAFEPALAVSWDVSDDSRSWRFRLRKGVRFHDGTLCDAAAVASSLHRMARPDKGYTLGAPGVWHQYLGGARITAAEPFELHIDLEQPVADLLDILVQGFIASPSSLATLDAGQRHPWIGTGPFEIVTAETGSVRAQRTAHHFGDPIANEAVRWQAVSSSVERLAQLQSGAAHVATSLDPRASKVLEANGVMRHVTLDPVAIIYLLNAAQGPLSDGRVRRALSLAVDRKGLIDNVVGGMAEPLDGFVSPLHFGAAEHPAPHALRRARELLGEAGHQEGLTLRVDCPTSLPDEAEALTIALSKQLKRVGITLQVRHHTDREAYAHMVRHKEIGDMCVFDSSPLSTFRVLYEKIDSRIAGSWWQGYRNAAVEQFLDTARAEADAESREALYREIYLLLQEDPPWLTLYNPLRATGLRGSHPEFCLSPEGVLDVRRLPSFA